MKKLRLLLQIVVPLLLLLLGALASSAILRLKKPPAVANFSFEGPPVRTTVVAAEDTRIDVLTQGTVEAFRSIDLAAQVGGRVLRVADSLRAGGFFAADDELLVIDPSDYQLQVVQQEAAVARAELRLLQERAEAAAAVRAFVEIEGAAPTDPLVARSAQVDEAAAALAAARAQLAKARLDLERTVVKAPFAGRVRRAMVDQGQIVQPGQALAQIHDISYAEVRLPLAASDAAFVALPLHGSQAADGAPTDVELWSEFGGQRHRWQARLTRTEGEVDRRSRQWIAIAQVENPYAPGGSTEQPPLAIGSFVQARISGRLQRGVISIPRTALRGDDEVWLVDAESRLRSTKVEVLRRDPERVWLRSGLATGDRICVLPPETPTDGMPVRPLPAADTGPGGGQR